MKKYSFAIIIMVFFSCQKQSIAPSDSYKVGEIKFSMSLATAPEDVASISGFLSRISYDTIFFNFTIYNDSASTLVENVVSGEWNLTVNAFNQDNIIIYTGSKIVFVSPGILTPVYLQLNPVTGSLDIIVTWGIPNPIDSTLIAYYPFNGNANDESGNANDGIVHGASLTEDRFGNPNSAYWFDGINDFIDIGNNPILKPQLPISICAWIKIYGQPGNILVTNYSESNYYGVSITINWNTGNFNINYGDGGPIGIQSRRSKHTSIPPFEQWFYFVGVIRNSSDMDIYFDANNVGGTYSGFGGSINYNDSPANIGRVDCNDPGPADYFNGVLDDIRIYNKALSLSEVESLFISSQ